MIIVYINDIILTIFNHYHLSPKAMIASGGTSILLDLYY